jgi:hypothetical protein
MSLITALRRQKQFDLCKFKTSLIYIASFSQKCIMAPYFKKKKKQSKIKQKKQTRI